MNGFLLGLAVGASVSSSIALWIVATRLTAILGTLSVIAHALHNQSAGKDNEP